MVGRRFKTAAVAVLAMVGLWLSPFGLPAAAPAGTDMVPTFSEDFAGTSLNTRSWNQDYGSRAKAGGPIGKRSLWSNGEAQIYFDKRFLKLGIDPFTVSNGILVINARALTPQTKQSLYGELARHPEFMRGLKAAPRIDYSSGVITTRDLFQQRYGYFEIRAKWSAGKGIWPAFWLLPADGSWPPELDVMEAHGDKPQTAFQTFHPRNGQPAGVTGKTDGSQQEFHVYGALWAPDHIDFYIDGRKTGSVTPSAEMDKPMYVLANLAIGGYWPGYPDPDPNFTATMSIDYIKIWQFRSCIDGRKPCLIQ